MGKPAAAGRRSRAAGVGSAPLLDRAHIGRELLAGDAAGLGQLWVLLITGRCRAGDGRGVVDPGAIRGSRRSSPATYTGLRDPIRKASAKASGVEPAC
jgi:hypothetical protein